MVVAKDAVCDLICHNTLGSLKLIFINNRSDSYDPRPLHPEWVPATLSSAQIMARDSASSPTAGVRDSASAIGVPTVSLVSRLGKLPIENDSTQAPIRCPRCPRTPYPQLPRELIMVI
ncbi:hypothetical protein Godav_015044 [Gossypium davidsonii]|uniref:Uncharacterized protein n=1 Tax=Gossypium davidsonii TaxID=34287 RepID=A0A7J8RM02_GOSDV|nr:hypothetical protein [Gossypium davidsonii]